MDVGLVNALVVATGEEATARHAAPNRTRPTKPVAVKRLVARRQKRLARSIGRANFATGRPPCRGAIQPAAGAALAIHLSPDMARGGPPRRFTSKRRATAVARPDEAVVVETVILAGSRNDYHLARSLSEVALAQLLGMVD
ncbi:hypothetical protein D3273_15135 [Lichenibacterium minor]|uniref:Uncharacterized protein n=1 Tax=Lichenibacterium minor TaxID=2316528 RepID=A0A4Q2U4D2_9HYPH|nr:hypothetical protein [Lichenibacterium minor]RYC31222.1 hypothetical protein D3273_15135 [Lichenibacterium minor]